MLLSGLDCTKCTLSVSFVELYLMFFLNVSGNVLFLVLDVECMVVPVGKERTVSLRAMFL